MSIQTFSIKGIVEPKKASIGDPFNRRVSTGTCLPGTQALFLVRLPGRRVFFTFHVSFFFLYYSQRYYMGHVFAALFTIPAALVYNKKVKSPAVRRAAQL